MESALNAEAIRQGLTRDKRRRSLKTLFQLPLSARSSTHGSALATAAVGSLPADIVREVVDLLTPADILSFSLTVRDFPTSIQ